VFSRGMCFSDSSDARVPAQSKKQQQQTDAYAAGPLAFMLTTEGQLECYAVVQPREPLTGLRRSSARRPQPLPAPGSGGVAAGGDEEEEEEGGDTEVEEGEEGEVKVRRASFRRA